MYKGVYSYECMESWECFSETSIPPKEAFYNKLVDEHISDDDYAMLRMSGRPLTAQPRGIIVTYTATQMSIS